MPQKNDIFIGTNYGWEVGEDGWGEGMNSSLLMNAFLHNRRINGSVSSLPLSPTDGDAYFLTTDLKTYFRSDDQWHFIDTPVGFEFILKSTEEKLKFDGTSVLKPIPSIFEKVSGPISSQDNEVALFSGTSGDILKTGSKMSDYFKNISYGSKSLPSISFSDASSGFYRKGPNSIAVVTQGEDRIVVTSNGRVGVGIESPTAKAMVKNENPVGDSIVNGAGFRVDSRWQGSTAQPYQNNDCTLFETFNKVLSDSTNYSWSVSAPNGYNDIPAGVTDSGHRIGVYGWAISTPIPGYSHAGTLALQIGVRGTGGFLGPGTPSSAIVTEAIGVRGEVVHDSVGSTVLTATAGDFISVATVGSVQNNYGVRVSATGGSIQNWSYHGDAGKFFNQDQALFGSKFTEMDSKVCVRGVGNSIEFGYAGAGGYGSSLGAMPISGDPFIALGAKVDATTDTFTTDGQLGFVISNSFGGDALMFGRLTNTNGSGLTPSEVFRIDENGRVHFQSTPIIAPFAPANSSAPGQTGQISFDSDFIYICTGTNTWKRTPLSTW